MSNGDQLLKAYSLLSALQRNVPSQHDVEARWVQEFHSAVDGIESATGLSLTEFRVPADAIDPKSEWYKSGLWCERSILMQKVDALLTYFTGLNQEQEKRIGFHAQ